MWPLFLLVRTSGTFWDQNWADLVKFSVFLQNRIIFSNAIHGTLLSITSNGFSNKTVISCLFQGFRFFSGLVGGSDPWSKKWWVIFWNDGPTAGNTVKPVLSGHSIKKTNYRLMQVKSIAECSKGSILQYFWPSLSCLLFLRSLFCLFFQWLLRTGFTALTTYMYILFCGIRRLPVRWIFLLKWDFSHLKRMGPVGPLPQKVMGHIFKSWDNDSGPP